MAKPANIRNVRSTPAKSAVQKAVMQKMQPATKPVPSNVIPVPGGGAPRGRALAESHFSAAMAESAGWRDRFADIIGLGSGDSLAAYKKDLNAHKKEQAAQSKVSGIQISRSAGVRLSECLTVAKATGKGLTVDALVEMYNAKGIGAEKTFGTIGHAAIVTMARAWNDTHDADGAEISAEATAIKRGKKALPVGEKVKRYVLSNVTIADLPMVAAMMVALAARVKTPQDVENELAKKEPVAVVPAKGAKKAPKGAKIEQRAAKRVPVAA